VLQPADGVFKSGLKAGVMVVELTMGFTQAVNQPVETLLEQLRLLMQLQPIHIALLVRFSSWSVGAGGSHP
jgi:hypothetical protein